MKRRLVLASPALALAGAAFAQSEWKPTRPIRLIVPYGPGGSADQVARIYGERLAAALGQQIIVEDKPGARAGEARTRRRFTLNPPSCQWADPSASNVREDQWLKAINTAPCMRVR